MAVYPTTPAPSYGSQKRTIIEALRTESEGGYGRTRKKFTRTKYGFELVYNNLTSSQYSTLEAFFVANQGSTFDFSYDSVSYVAMFAMDSISKTEIASGICSTNIQLVTV